MLVERDGQLADLARMLDASRPGRGSLAVITGPVSAGKTELLHTLSERASATGCRVLLATGSLDEQDRPYGLVEQLLQPGSPGIPETPKAAPPGPLTERCLYQTLVRLSVAAPVLVIIDDAQYADGPSLRSLLYLIRRGRTLPVMVAVSCGPQLCAAHPPLIGDLLYQGSARHFPLGLLSREGVAALVTQLVAQRQRPGTSSHRGANTYAALSGGNPALISALLADGVHGVADSGLGPGPRSPVAISVFAQTVLACVHRSGADAVAVARGLAVLGHVPDISLLSELADLDDHATVRAVQSLTAAGILAGGKFRASATRLAVLDQLPGQERAKLRYRAARILQNAAANPVDVARQLLAIAPVREPWAVAVLSQAAEISAAQDRVALTVRCLRLAQRCCAEEQRATIKAQLAIAQSRPRPQPRPSAAPRHHLHLARPPETQKPQRSPEPATDDPRRLSRAERRVAALASTGRTNKEISDELFITVSTVEQHMTRIYRKTGIRRRQDLSGLITPAAAQLRTGS